MLAFSYDDTANIKEWVYIISMVILPSTTTGLLKLLVFSNVCEDFTKIVVSKRFKTE